LQIGVAVAFILIPLLNHYRISTFSGNFLCFNAAGLPLADPLAVLQITLKNYYLSIDLLIGAGIALGLALALGTAFCSWICPFGLLSELTYELGWRVLPKKYKGFTTEGKGFPVKTWIFGFGLLGFFFFSTTPVLNQLSMPAWYSRIFQFYFEQRHISLAIVMLLAVLFVEFVTRNRLWCRYLCPQAFLLVLFKLFNPFRLKIGFRKDKCLYKKGINPCQRACSLALDPKVLGDSLETECTNCGDCVVACKKMGQALEFQFGLLSEYPANAK